MLLSHFKKHYSSFTELNKQRFPKLFVRGEEEVYIGTREQAREEIELTHDHVPGVLLENASAIVSKNNFFHLY